MFQDSYTPLIRTIIKQSPSLGFFKGAVKTKQTAEKLGSGQA